MSNYKVVKEYLQTIGRPGDTSPEYIQELVRNEGVFLDRLNKVDSEFFNGRIAEIDSNNYNEIIEEILTVHGTSGNDFNIWSKSGNQLSDEHTVIREQLKETLGFLDGRNGQFKAFLGKERLISFILKKFEGVDKSTHNGMSLEEIEKGIRLLCETSTKIDGFYADDENIVEGFKNIDSADLRKCGEWYGSRSGVIIDLRKELVNRLLAGEQFTVASLNELIEKHKLGKESKFKSYQQTFSIVFPVFTFYAHNKHREFVDDFTDQLIVDLNLEDYVKKVSFDFQGVRQQGSDRYWVAIYNKTRETQSESLQFFFEFHKGKIGYGVYRYNDDTYLKPKKLLSPEEFQYSEMRDYFLAEREIIVNDVPDYGELNRIYLGDGKLYKISHGSFKKKKDRHIIEAFKENNWIAIHEDTGKGQAGEFKEELRVGDYVYITIGSNELIGIAKVVSDEWNYVPDDMVQDDGWIYREVELILPAVRKSPKDLIDKRNHFPSGNSTLSEVKPEDLTESNDLLFTPYFNVEFVTGIERETAKSEDLNHILFGPPGTGKTYNTINKALVLSGIDISDKKRKELKSLFKAKVNEGRIVFTTFHQSMTYEDFIEGIKPKSKDGKISYHIEDGIFKQLCYKAMYAHYQNEGDETVSRFQEFDRLYDDYISDLQTRLSELGEEELLLLPLRTKGYYTQVKDVNEEEHYILTRGNGANSDVKVSKDKLRLVYNSFSSPDEIVNVSDDIRSVGKGLGWSSNYYGVFCDLKRFEATIPKQQSRRSVSYNDYEKIKELIETEGFPSEYKKDVDKFVIIIDEINRGNISSIFGELITLLENDKRLGKEESLDVVLPYSKKEFGVPPNIYVLGTMNTADRSVEALDSALRRRFSFKEMPPKSDLIRSEGKASEGIVDGLDLSLLLDTINKRVEKLLDKDHMIGHSYFLTVTGIEDLKMAFHNKIIPLLQEYFYGDVGKIGLVLGSEFFKDDEQDVDDDFFAPFDDYESGGLMERKVYHLLDVSKMDSGAFKKALISLMRM